LKRTFANVISGCTAHSNKILTTRLKFSMLFDRTLRRLTHCDNDRRQKTEMAAGKPEVVITLVRNKIPTDSNGYTHIFDVVQSNAAYNYKVRRSIHCQIARTAGLLPPSRFWASVSVSSRRSMQHSIGRHEEHGDGINRWNRFHILFKTKVITTSDF
jgi:hypothetical protein